MARVVMTRENRKDNLRGPFLFAVEGELYTADREAPCPESYRAMAAFRKHPVHIWARYDPFDESLCLGDYSADEELRRAVWWARVES